MPAVAISITISSPFIITAPVTIMIIRTITMLPFLASFTVIPTVAITIPVPFSPVKVPFSISTTVSATLPVLVLLSFSVPLSGFRGPAIMWLCLVLGAAVGVVGEPGGLGRRGPTRAGASGCVVGGVAVPLVALFVIRHATASPCGGRWRLGRSVPIGDS